MFQLFHINWMVNNATVIICRNCRNWDHVSLCIFNLLCELFTTKLPLFYGKFHMNWIVYKSFVFNISGIETGTLYLRLTFKECIYFFQCSLSFNFDELGGDDIVWSEIGPYDICFLIYTFKFDELFVSCYHRLAIVYSTLDCIL